MKNISGDSTVQINGHQVRAAQSAAGKGAEKKDEISLIEDPLAPPVLSDTALHGLIGEVVKIIEPHTEIIEVLEP